MHRAHESRLLLNVDCVPFFFFPLSLTSGEMGIVAIRGSGLTFSLLLLLLILRLSVGQRTSAYVSVRQHKSGYVRIRQDTSGYVRTGRPPHFAPQRTHPQTRTSACLCCTPVPLALVYRQHTSAYVSPRQHTSTYVSTRQHASAYLGMPQLYARNMSTSLPSAYVSIRQHTSSYVSTPRHA